MSMENVNYQSIDNQLEQTNVNNIKAKKNAYELESTSKLSL